MSKEHEQQKIEALQESFQALREAAEDERTYTIFIDHDNGSYQNITLGAESRVLNMALNYLLHHLEDNPALQEILSEHLL